MIRLEDFVGVSLEDILDNKEMVEYLIERGEDLVDSLSNYSQVVVIDAVSGNFISGSVKDIVSLEISALKDRLEELEEDEIDDTEDEDFSEYWKKRLSSEIQELVVKINELTEFLTSFDAMLAEPEVHTLLNRELRLRLELKEVLEKRYLLED